MPELTKRLTFVAAHRLRNPKWTDEKNGDVFGKCARLHGHDYAVEATVAGPIDPLDGMVLNLTDLKRVLREEIHDRCDHQFLNDIFPQFHPTVENLALEFFGLIDAALEPDDVRAELVRVRVYESPENWCDVTREEFE